MAIRPFTAGSFQRGYAGHLHRCDPADRARLAAAYFVLLRNPLVKWLLRWRAARYDSPSVLVLDRTGGRGWAFVAFTL